MTTAYTGPSIVDYLTSAGQASDYNSRAALATKYGITNYTGSADQNTQLLNSIRSQPASPGISGTTGAPNTGQTTVSTPQSAPVTAAPAASVPTVANTTSIINAILAGQVDPNTIDSYIDSQTRAAFGNSAAQAAALVKQGIAGKDLSYGGQNYQYNGGNLTRTSTIVNNSVTNGAGTTSTTGSIPAPGTATPAPAPAGAPAAAPVAPVATPVAPAAPVAPVGAPAVVPVAPAGAPAAAQSTYTGGSVVDYLNSLGKSSDFASRSALAASMGIQGYTGTAAQNNQLLSTLRSQNGGSNVSTATAAASGAATGSGGTGTGASGTPGVSDDTNNILTNATAIAKSFGWTAPDPTQSPLNIATQLFTQGLAAFGLNDLKTEISNVLQQQTDLQNKKADEAADINANPWLTEGERVNRLTKLDDKYSTKLDILTHQQQLAEADYKTGLDQVQWQVGQAMTAYNTAQTNNDKIFSDALTLAEKQIDAKNALLQSQKPISVSAGSTLYDPATGKALYTAPDKSTDGILSVSEAQALGVPYGTKKSDAAGITPTKNLTDAQSKDLNYAQRSDEANTTINSLESTVAGWNSGYFSAQKLFEGNDLTNPLASPEIKQLRQAERNFETAVLRRESGAAISASEFATDEKKYFPRPGDDAQTLAQKAQARATAISSLKGSVPGYSSRTAAPAASAATYSVNGKIYTQGADGLYYAQ